MSNLRKLMVGALLAALPTLSTAQLGPIVVTPSGVEQPRGEANTSVTVIDRPAIERSNARSLAELLRGQAGLHVSDLFGDGNQATVDLRGFGPSAASNTLLLIDGRRLNHSTDTAAPDLAALDLDDVERIEILQGSAGVLYGNQAVGGVINIIPRRIDNDLTTLGLRVGSYDSVSVQARLQRLFGQTRISLGLGDSRTDNYRDSNDVERRDLRLRAERRHQSVNYYAELEKSDEDYQTPGALLEDEVADDREQSLALYRDDFFATETDFLRLGLERTLDENRSLGLGLSQRVTDREFIQSLRPTPGDLSTQDRDSRALAAVYRVTPRTPRHYTGIVAGVDVEKTDYELVSAFGPQAIDQRIADLYLATQWLAGARGRIDAGLRYSDNDADIDGEAFDDSLSVASLGYGWSEAGLRLFARADQNYRYPTVEEHTNVPFGDPPGLETQRGVSIELGSEWQRAGSRYRATLYRIRLDDEIGFDSSGFSNLNIEKTERTGLLFEAARQFGERFDASLSLTLLDAGITGHVVKYVANFLETFLRAFRGPAITAGARGNAAYRPLLASRRRVFLRARGHRGRRTGARRRFRKPARSAGRLRSAQRSRRLVCRRLGTVGSDQQPARRRVRGTGQPVQRLQ